MISKDIEQSKMLYENILQIEFMFKEASKTKNSNLFSHSIRTLATMIPAIKSSIALLNDILEEGDNENILLKCKKVRNNDKKELIQKMKTWLKNNTVFSKNEGQDWGRIIIGGSYISKDDFMQVFAEALGECDD